MLFSLRFLKRINSKNNIPTESRNYVSNNQKAALIISMIVVAITAVTCASKPGDRNQGEGTMVAKKIEAVLGEHSKELMSLPSVVGTAQGLCDNKPCIKIYVIKRATELDEKIPDILEGYPVIIEETGGIRALPENQY